jgi:hypothetical protein
MVDPSEYKIAFLAAVSGWLATNPIGAWFSLHPLATYAAQGMITIALGCGAVVAQHFVRRWLKRNWPEDAQEEQAAQALRAASRVDWFKLLRPIARPLFDLVRGAISRLRRRKES